MIVSAGLRKPFCVLLSLVFFILLLYSSSGHCQERQAEFPDDIFNEFKSSDTYRKVYCIEWKKEDDRQFRKQILLLVGGAGTGLAKQVFKSLDACVDKYLDDLGDQEEDNEESDERLEYELQKLGDSIKGYHPIYSYKATVNNDRPVYFILGEYTLFGLERWDIVMITDKYIISESEEDQDKILMKRVFGENKVYNFSTFVPHRIQVLNSKMDHLEKNGGPWEFWKK